MDDELRDAPPARLPVPILRALQPTDSVEVRSADDGEMPVMSGHFSMFGNWYEVNSWIEGRFLERIARGGGELRRRQRLAHHLDEHHVGAVRRRAAAQQRRVAALEANPSSVAVTLGRAS